MRNEVKELSFELAANIVLLQKKHYTHLKIYAPLIMQLLKSGTSIGANIEEACAAQSKKDFLCKMYIAFKEARETIYWLRLIKRTEIFNSPEIDNLLDNAGSILRLLTSITNSTKKNLLSKSE